MHYIALKSKGKFALPIYQKVPTAWLHSNSSGKAAYLHTWLGPALNISLHFVIPQLNTELFFWRVDGIKDHEWTEVEVKIVF